MTDIQSWAEFEVRLSATLADLPEHAFLILNVRDSENRYVQFSNRMERGFRAETVSDAFLEEGERIGEEGRERLQEMGWLPPDPAPEGPRSNINHYREWPNPAPFDEVARLGVKALVEVFEVASPSELAYFANDDKGRIRFPSLSLEFGEEGLLFEPGPETTLKELDGFVEAYLSAFTGKNDLKRDDDGDIPFRAGSATFYVRVFDEENPKVRVFAPMMWDVEESDELFRAVNDLNNIAKHARVMWTGGQIIAITDIPGPFLTLDYLQYVCNDIAALADTFDEKLEERLGGTSETAETDPEKPTNLPGYL